MTDVVHVMQVRGDGGRFNTHRFIFVAITHD